MTDRPCIWPGAPQAPCPGAQLSSFPSPWSSHAAPSWLLGPLWDGASATSKVKAATHCTEHHTQPPAHATGPLVQGRVSFMTGRASNSGVLQAAGRAGASSQHGRKVVSFLAELSRLCHRGALRF